MEKNRTKILSNKYSMKKINYSENLLSGLAFFCFGIFFCIKSFDYEIGSFSDMGPGFYPLLFSILLILLSLILILKSINGNSK